MKKRLISQTIVLMLLLLYLTSEAGVIMIENASGFTIAEIHISNSGTDNWGVDMLGQDVLRNGETHEITLNESYWQFDMRAIDESGTFVEWFKLPCGISQITILEDGTAEYK